MEPVSQLTLEELPEHVRRAGELALERKAHDVVVLDLRGISTATDYFVLATGTSDTQVKAIADHILDELRNSGEKPAHMEGRESAHWVLMDYINFVVHVFHPQARGFYQLESLWGDAPRVEMTEEAPPA